MSNALYGKLFEQAKKEQPSLDPYQIADFIDQKLEGHMSKKWAVGFHDRGMGHGDYGVIVEDTDTVLVECGPCQQLAEHIVNAHNYLLVINKG